jgi:cold-inducible RNA-binding protein
VILPVQYLPTLFFKRPCIMSENRLFVGNLAYQTMENDLQDYFSQAGSVTSVNLMMDKFTGKSRGFAFVEFASPDDANKAVEMFHSKDFQGRALTVNIARPREERAPRREGGGGGGGGGGWRGNDRGGDRGGRGDRDGGGGGYRARR